MKTGELLGRTVEDCHGREIGRLEEIVVDRLTGRITFAVIELDGAEPANKYLPVPWGAIGAPTNGDSVRLHLAERRIAAAPKIDGADLGALERHDVGVEVYSYYGLQPPWEGGAVGHGEGRGRPDTARRGVE